MLRNFIKITFRNLARNKGYSFLNISGLAIGMASAMLILLWVKSEFNYDAFYKNSDRLYQSWNKAKGNDGWYSWNNTPKALGPGLKARYPEIEKATRVNWDANILFNYGDKKLNVRGTMVEPDFLTMFQFPFLEGDMNSALNNPNDIIVTEKLAKTLFGNEEAVGKTVLLDQKYNMKVSAVMKDLPGDTQFDFQYLLPWSYVVMLHQDDSSWSNNSTHTFVMVKQGANINSVNAKIKNIILEHNDPGSTVQSFLYPVSKLHLYSKFENGIPVGGKIDSVKVLLLIAIFILLIACINFMNMSTARSEKRAKEVGIRKVAGALKRSLVFQFIGESILISLFSGIIALALVQLALPAFNQLVQKQLFIDYSKPDFWFSFLGFVLFTGVIAGSYPAFYLSSFKPVSVLKGGLGKVSALVTPRKILVVLQFSFAIVLIVSTIIVWQQIRYAQDRNSGYNKNNLVYIFLSGDIEKNYELIKNDLLQKHIALSVTKTSAPLTEDWSSGGADWVGKDPNDRSGFRYFNSDGNLVKTAGFQMAMGRDIDVKKYPTDSSAAIINESALRVMKFKDPIGQIINRDEKTGFGEHIIGVMKDFILSSPYQSVEPMIIRGPANTWFNVIHIKLDLSRPLRENLADMQKTFARYNPEYPFEYHFIDQEYAKKFSDEQLTGTLSALFAGLTIFISCFGLFGLAAYMAENRIKEIGVRKVLGASVSSITTLLSKDFVLLVLFAILIATPIAWLSMDKWLSTFSYHVLVSPWVFIVSGTIAVIIAILTVSYQAIKAALANPIKSLRTQ